MHKIIKEAINNPKPKNSLYIKNINMQIIFFSKILTKNHIMYVHNSYDAFSHL